jgi:hypothetical protein
MFELHLEELKKQGLAWKLDKHVSPTRAFLKVNNNQPIILVLMK